MRNFRPDVTTGSRSTLKPPSFFQLERKINFFTSKVLLIETADSFEIASCSEKKCAGPKIQAEINQGKPAQQHASPNGNKSVHRHSRAASGVTTFQSGDSLTHMRSIDSRVGVNEEQILALRSACACIPRGCDLASIDWDHLRAGPRRDLRRRVR